MSFLCLGRLAATAALRKLAGQLNVCGQIGGLVDVGELEDPCDLGGVSRELFFVFGRHIRPLAAASPFRAPPLPSH